MNRWASSTMLALALLAAPAMMNAEPVVSVTQSARKMAVPDGFHVTLFAGEPDLVQPINFSLDERGRLWVCENFSYPNGALSGDDRIAIFEDTDGDGRFDTKKIFAEGFGYLTGSHVGDGGVYVLSSPWLLFFPDKDGDDKPDGPPVKLLEGWTWKGKHNVVNSLTWGPDGWLYGLHGITENSLVGKPGTTDAQKTKVGPGVWRYHPKTEKFEFITEGTCNPWGIDFNEYGDAFITTSVVPHLYQVIHGAHYQRMFGKDFNPHVYIQMQNCADHLHWGGGEWTTSRDARGVHGTAGGGHSHAGGLIYQGTMFPQTYRGSILMCNIHGNRINRDTFTRKDSGYVASHAPDLLFANDKWFRGVTIHQGRLGEVYFSDWSDTGECHQYDDPATETGRLYRLTYGPVKEKPQDLRKLSDMALVDLQLSPNEFLVRHARRILAERGPNRRIHAALVKLLDEQPETPRKLRALWALYCTGGAHEKLLTSLLNHEDEHLRSWAIRLLTDHSLPLSAAVHERFTGLAKDDPSPMVRLHLASALQRLPLEQRWDIVQALVADQKDADDQYLPFMYWYAIEPLVKADTPRALGLMAGCKIAKIRELIARRAAAR